jgi:4-hydroxyphenylpyruvate dioxygenase
MSKLSFWMQLADNLHTDLIQVPSNFLPESQCTSDKATIISDLREVADAGLAHKPHPIRFAYEALCWGTHIDLWDEAWEIVKAVDRPNFGTCLDTFNLCGRVWGDPASPTGQTANADEDIKRSIAKLRSEIDVAKIFYVEVVDAERMITPLTQAHPWWADDQKPRMSWSRNARLFPFEDRGYLPIMDALTAITESVGYTGYISFELFSRTCNESHEGVPEEHAARGERSWEKMADFMGWDSVENGGKVDPELELRRQDSGFESGRG